MNYGEEAVVALLDVLNGAGIPYMMVGSFSSNAYGEPRSTKDADFVVQLDANSRKNILEKLPSDFEIDWQTSFETITGHTRQILKIPSIPFEIELFGPQRMWLSRNCAGQDLENASRTCLTHKASFVCGETDSTGSTSRNGAVNSV